jgi:hypothetical protein
VQQRGLADARLAGDDRQTAAAPDAAHDIAERGALRFPADDSWLAQDTTVTGAASRARRR